jgi:hypothetical protein
MLTGDEARPIRGEIRHKGSYFFWSSKALNWCGRNGLQHILSQALFMARFGITLTAPPLFEFASVPAPLRTFNGSTGEDVYLRRKC